MISERALIVTKWDARWLRLAGEVSTWSKDPSTRVGAVIIDKRGRMIAHGYNGPPPGADDQEIMKDRDCKLALTIHAEEGALRTSTSDPEGCSIYITRRPCDRCIVRIAAAQLRNVYYVEDLEFEQRWPWSPFVTEHMVGLVDLYAVTQKQMELLR